MAEQKIAGRHFVVKPPLATDALKLQFRVLNLLGAGASDLATVFSALQGARTTSDVSDRIAANAKVAGAVIGILGRMEPDEGVRFISDMVAMAQIKAANGSLEQVDLDTEFSNDPSGLYELVGYVLKVVLGPFISGLTGAMSDRKAG